MGGESATAVGLGARERAILGDLRRVGVMTTSQIHRLRFLGTGLSNCRRALAALRRSGLVQGVMVRGAAGGEVCWTLTAPGRMAAGLALGQGAAVAEAEPGAVRRRLAAAERYVQRELVNRWSALQAGLDTPDPAARP